jgi:hypothetical protein
MTSLAPVAQNYLDSEQTSVRQALSTISTTVGPKLRTALRVCPSIALILSLVD